MTTGATLFTGFGGVDIGMHAAGVEVVYGLEYQDDIAAVARANGFPVTVADILDVDPASVPCVDVLHASPPCPNFSVAKQGRAETPHDLALAQRLADIVTTTRPAIFTLENVMAYVHSQSFHIIVTALSRAGYMLRWQNVNAADMGVPQKRRRLWLRAVRDDLLPELPAPDPWRGWYDAIVDLIPGLPESEFAPWQLSAMREPYCSLLVGAGGYDSIAVHRRKERPAFTVTANHNQATQIKAFIVDDQNTGDPDANGERGLTIRDNDAPMFTVSATQTKRSIRAWLSQGRVVAMTPRCLARFQSFPDWYALPENNTLACRGIGNAVPPLLYEKMLRQMIQDFTIITAYPQPPKLDVKSARSVLL